VLLPARHASAHGGKLCLIPKEGGLALCTVNFRDWWMQIHKLQGQGRDAQAGNPYNLYYMEFAERKMQTSIS
jgi:hypothetical protein